MVAGSAFIRAPAIVESMLPEACFLEAPAPQLASTCKAALSRKVSESCTSFAPRAHISHTFQFMDTSQGAQCLGMSG